MWGVEICKIYSKIMKKYHHCVKFTYPLSFQTRIPKVDQHTGGKWLIHGWLDYRRIYASLGLNELTLMSWGTTLISSVQPLKLWCKMGENVRWINTFSHFLLYLFILSNKTEPIEWPVCGGFPRTLCYFAGTVATNVQKNWYGEVIAKY